MSVATLTPRVREALSVSSDYDAATIPALIRRQINGLLRDYNFPKSIVKMETLVDVGDEAVISFALPDGFKKEHLVVIYDPTSGLYGEPLKRREGLITGSSSPDYYWLEGTNIVLNAPIGVAGYYLLVYYQSMDAAANEAWFTTDFEDVLFTRSVYRGAAEFQKPELASSFAGLWAEDQRSLAIYANELEFGGLDMVQRELRGTTCRSVIGVFGAGANPYGGLLARVIQLENDQKSVITAVYSDADAVGADVGVSLNEASAELALAGGGTIHINVPGNYRFTTPIVLQSGVSLICGPNVWLKWYGANAPAAPLIESLSTEVLRGARVILNVDSQGYQGTIVRIHSAFLNSISVLHTGYSVVSTVLELIADSTGGGDGYSKRNVVANEFRLRSQGTAGNLLVTSGQAVGSYDGSPAVVTLNGFYDLFGHDQFLKGIDFKSWTDNNNFPGFTRVAQSSSDNTIGVDFGSVHGSSVYSNKIEQLAVDNFNVHVGQIGVRFGALTRANEVPAFHQIPPSDYPVVVDPLCTSYKIGWVSATTGEVVEDSKFLTYAADNFTTSKQFTLADDEMYQLPIKRGVENNATCLVELVCSDINGNGLYRLQVGNVQTITPVWRENTVFQAYGAGAPIATVAGHTDNRITVYVDSAGVLSFVNRLGYLIKAAIRVSNVVRF